MSLFVLAGDLDDAGSSETGNVLIRPAQFAQDRFRIAAV